MKTRLLLSLVSLIALAACGGTAEPASSSQGPVDSAPADEPRTPQVVGSLPEATTAAPFHVFVSNQSFEMDPVDIDVYVDGIRLIEGDFRVEGQHSWSRFDFRAEANKSHSVRAVSKKGGVEKSVDVEVATADRWVVVNFWYYGPSHYSPTPPSFGIDAFDEEPMFE